MAANWWESDAQVGGAAPAVASTPAAPAAKAANFWDSDSVVGAPSAAPAAPSRGVVDTAKAVGMGVLRGAKDVVDTGASYLSKGFDKIAGTNEGARVDAMNEAGKADFTKDYGDSTAASLGRVGGQVVASLPVGGAIGTMTKLGAAAGLAPKVLAPLGEAIASGGMRAGGAGMATRIAGGAISGGATGAAVDPDAAGTGAVLGAALPGAARVLGAAGKAVGNTIRGPEVSDSARAAVKAAQDAGYVLPPTQAKPTLANRLLEGFAGKLTTAQNASAANQQVTNDLAKRAIGAAELTPEGIAAVRKTANQAYDELGKVGKFTTDDAFRSQLYRVGSGTKSMRTEFPELVNAQVDTLVDGLASRGEFTSQGAIEALKRLRYNGGVNKAALDPEKKQLGQAQMKIASALEGLIERNLEKSGQVDLLGKFRDARQTLAKAYDVEKALNAASGNVDAAAFARLAKKGRPLSGDLKSIGDTAAAFPKAMQAVDRMGSLPQTSPLDWAAAGGIGAATGSPMALLGLLGRPLARKVALSPAVQRTLAEAPAPRLGYRPIPGGAADLLTRAAPVVLTNRDQ